MIQDRVIREFHEESNGPKYPAMSHDTTISSMKRHLPSRIERRSNGT